MVSIYKHLLLASLLASLIACSEDQKFSGNDDEGSGDPEGTELADEPVMVGGAYLTCNHKEGVEKIYDDGRFHVGCRIANRANGKTVSLRNYDTEWLLQDDSENEVFSTVLQDNLDQVPNQEKYWHLVYSFPNASYKSLDLDVKVKAAENEVAFVKDMSYFDETRDRGSNQLRLAQLYSDSGLDFIPPQPKQMDIPDLTAQDPNAPSWTSAFLGFFDGFNKEVQKIDWGRQKNSSSRTQQRWGYSRKSRDAYNQQSANPQSSGSSSNSQTESKSESAEEKSGSSTGTGTTANLALTSQMLMWQESGRSDLGRGFAKYAMDSIDPATCQPSGVQRYSGQNNLMTALNQPTKLDFSKADTCVLDYTISSGNCAGVFILSKDTSSPYGYRVVSRVIQLNLNPRVSPVDKMTQIINTVQHHKCQL